MNKLKKISYFQRFKEQNKEIYNKLKNILLHMKFNSIIYFNYIDLHVKEILTDYSTIERQILLKSIISETIPNKVIFFDIFPNQLQINLNNKINDNKEVETPNWLKILYHTEIKDKKIDFYQ